jgi:hypothetical protein
VQYSAPHATHLVSLQMIRNLGAQTLNLKLDLAPLQMIRNLERQAIMFRYYFQALNPVMTSGNTGASYVDQEDDLYAKIDGFQGSGGYLRGHTTTDLGPTTTLSFGAYGRESTVALDALHRHSSSSCSCFSCFSLFRHKWRGNINSVATPMTDTPYESRLQSHASEVSQNHSPESQIQANANAPPTKPVPLVNQVLPSISAKDEEVKNTLPIDPCFFHKKPLLLTLIFCYARCTPLRKKQPKQLVMWCGLDPLL